MWKPGQVVTIHHEKFRVKQLTTEEIVDLVENHGAIYKCVPDLPLPDGCCLINRSFPSLPKKTGL